MVFLFLFLMIDVVVRCIVNGGNVNDLSLFKLFFITHKRCGNTKGTIKIDNPEKLTTCDTQDADNQNKDTTQNVLDITMPKSNRS